MSSVNTKTAYEVEALPVFDAIKGPVDSFILRNESKIKTKAVDTGYIPAGAFRDCSVFSNGKEALKQKAMRYDALNLREHFRVLWDMSPQYTIENLEERIFANYVVREAAVVEAARRLNSINDERQDKLIHADMYSNLLDEAQAQLYPRFDKEIAIYAANLVLSKIHEVDPKQAEILVAHYPFLAEKSSIKVPTLSQEKRIAWKEALSKEFGDALKQTRASLYPKKLSNETLVEASVHFMRAYGIPMQPEVKDGWSVLKKDTFNGFKVESKRKELHVGKRNLEITWPIFEGLMVHEVGVHIFRAQAGYNLNSHALANGLPGSDEAEEGLALLLESLWNNKELDEVGRDHFRYMAVAYSAGGYDGEMHTENDTFQFITRIMAAQKEGGMTDPAQVRSARLFGFDHVKRAFRGMPEGKRMLSNYAYLSGKLKMIKRYSKSEVQPSKLLQVDRQGKIDPTSKADTDFLKEVKEYVHFAKV